MKHPLIQGLLAVLPEPGSEFPPAGRAMWLRTLDVSLSFIYSRSQPVLETQPTESHDKAAAHE